MKYVFAILLLIVLVLACGCTGEAPVNSTPVQTTPVPTATATPAVSADSTVLAGLSSARPNASVTLGPGAVVLTFSADGAETMTFSFAGADYGEYNDLIIAGPYNGSMAFGPPVTAEYQINITGNGTWTAGLTRPDSTHPLSVPVNLTGSGAAVSPYIALEKGEYIFARNETGLSSPLYELRFANGSVVMDANNTCVLPCIGEDSSHPFVIIEIPENGSYLLGAIPRSSPHPWNVTISAVPAIPQMGPGPVVS